MMYELRSMDGAKFLITEAEKQAVLRAKRLKEPFVEFSRTGDVIFTSSLSGIYAETTYSKEQLEGRLHDGTRVVKQFGRWVCAADTKLFLDPAFYPEIAKDQVLTEEQWKNYDAKLLQPINEDQTVSSDTPPDDRTPEEIERTKIALDKIRKGMKNIGSG